jgi:F-type H+-transporting ATPase subunit b
MILPEIFNSVVYAQEAASGGVAGTLGLNLTYFIGQLITFAIVLFILWKFVFGPVAKKLQERTDRVEKAMSDADRIKKEKAEFEQWRQEQMTVARKEASEIVNKSQGDATKAREEILIKTKEDQQKLVDQAKEQIYQEKEQALSSAKSELANLVTTAAEKILKSKLDDKKDTELVKSTLNSIK